MSNNVQALKGFKLNSRDGEIGKVKEFYFDDNHWTIRYLVADSGSWLKDRQVLISPHALTDVNSESRHITVNLTKKQIEDSPSLDTDKPVSQQFEKEYVGYFGYPTYWSGPYMWGPTLYPSIAINQEPPSEPEETSWDVHLRSTEAVRGYHIESEDGPIGHVEDFIIDEQTWAVRYLVVDTKNWWKGKKVLISPQWISRVSWSEQKVFITLSRDAIKNAPEYNEEALFSREDEIGLHAHYQRPGYWDGEMTLKK